MKSERDTSKNWHFALSLFFYDILQETPFFHDRVTN